MAANAVRQTLSFFLFLCPGLVFAVPTITTITGTFTDGQSVTISGAGYGTKSPAAPLKWAPFTTSTDGSSLGQGTSWNQIQNVAWDSDEGYGSGGGVKGTAGSGAWTMRHDASGFSWNDASQKFHVMRRTKQNYIVPVNATNNQKNFRIWPAGGTGYSNLYWSIHNGRLFVENIGGSTDSGFWSSGLNPNSTSWIFEEIIIKASSANGVKDGSVVYRIDGTQRSSGSIISKSAAAPASWIAMYANHVVVANKGSWTGPSWSTSNNVWFDDTYIDNTWQRILIGDASTYGACRKFGLIVPSAWADTSITGTLQFHSNDFPAQTTAYAYVFDTSNVQNTAGKQFVIGGVAAGDPVPTITSINISTGDYNGGTASTATGTGFTATPTVLIGTQAATSVTFISATSLRFVIPAHTPGDSGIDLIITNPDSQFAVLQDTISYTSPANAPPYDVSAGDDRAITLPATTTFSGAALDDGLPVSPLTYSWAKASGPGTITFVDSTALVTDASFSTDGTYTVTMTANDSALTTVSPAVTIVVSPVVVSQSTYTIPSGTKFPWKP